MATPAENQAIVTRFEDTLDRGEVEAAAQHLSPDFIDHNAPPSLPPGPAGFKLFVEAVFQGFPDNHTTAREFITEGDKVVMRWAAGGIHTGDFMGIPATGKPITITGINIYRVADGKIVEYWHNEDILGVLQQIGAIPAPGQPG